MASPSPETVDKKSECVKVVIRCRPMSQTELSNGNVCVVTVDQDSGVVHLAKDGNEGRNFTFDAAYAQNCDQDTIYQNCGWAIVDSIMEGYNGTMFAYGQTGTGKTHTMVGELKKNLTNKIFWYLARCEETMCI